MKLEFVLRNNLQQNIQSSGPLLRKQTLKPGCLVDNVNDCFGIIHFIYLVFSLAFVTVWEDLLYRHSFLPGLFVQLFQLQWSITCCFSVVIKNRCVCVFVCARTCTRKISEMLKAYVALTKCCVDSTLDGCAVWLRADPFQLWPVFASVVLYRSSCMLHCR
jgi:hypothetical protein